ncbi:uncharacterized [Tachysurus ichikawai]
MARHTERTGEEKCDTSRNQGTGWRRSVKARWRGNVSDVENLPINVSQGRRAINNMADSKLVPRFFSLLLRGEEAACRKGTAVRIKSGAGRKKGKDKAKAWGFSH